MRSSRDEPRRGPGLTPVPPGPVGLVLAAGAGRRLGRGPKALLQIDGVPLVAALAGTLLAGGCSEIVVVTGAGAEDVAKALAGEARVRTVHNPGWRQGMGTSLRCGLQAIGPHRNVMVTPVDRPGITAAEVGRIIAAHRPGRITAAAHQDPDGRLRRGHPVLFDVSWCPAASAAAHADVGARKLLSHRGDVVDLIDCSDLEDGADLDVPADLARWVGSPGAASTPGSTGV
ncbi:NTP transferase domain-containing protein [Glutamicibacter creatinolyticus]|uniref:nucleotidyltransferase family protein n=1 Tax=Glutamicibacter creatinolyticus TaxID=162496 RepID=UPI0037BE485D